MKKFIILALFAGLMATVIPAAEGHTWRHRHSVARHIVYTGGPIGYYTYGYAPYGYGYPYGYGLSVGFPFFAIGFGGHHHHYYSGHHFHGYHH